MGALRRLGQSLGLIYREDGTWRPIGSGTPPATSGSRTGKRLPANPATKTPWWQTTGTARHNFLRAAYALALAVGALVCLLVFSINDLPLRWWFWLIFAVFFLWVGTVYLASAFAKRQRERSAANRTGQPDTDPGIPPSS